MSTKFVVGYDGSPASKRAVAFAIERAKAAGASIVIAYVLEWSPYTFLTKEELEVRHKRRGEELERAKTAIIDPLIAELGKDVVIEAEIKYGGIADTIAKIAETYGAAQIIVGRQGSASVAERFFGSTTSKLAQISSVPCTIVP